MLLLRDILIFRLPLLAARRTIDDRLAYASRSKLAPFVEAARANARGSHVAEAFITMIMLDRAGIGPDLPQDAAR